MIWTVSYLVVLFGLALFGLHRYFILFLYWKHRNNRPQPASFFAQLPVVTVQLPIYNEVFVAGRLLRAVGKIDYPRDRLEIQVLDDSQDETCEIVDREAASLRERGFDVVVLRRKVREGFKAGALDAGLRVAKGEFLMILDADFLPSCTILQETIHFFGDPNVGMIQTRWGHHNRSYSWLTRAQAILLDGHLVLEQTGRSRSGRFFNFNGTAGVWRRSCIEAAGGWQADTLTEDLDLSYRAQLCGWHFLFLADTVTPAELPIDMTAFRSQQHRWTKGSIQTCLKLLPRVWQSPLPLKIKLEATIHLTSNFSYLLLALLCVLLSPATGAMAGGESLTRTLLIDLPLFAGTTCSVAIFYLSAQRVLYPNAWLREIFFFPFVLALGVGVSVSNARAVLEALCGHRSEFSRTPKYGVGSSAQHKRQRRYLVLRSAVPVVEILFAAYFTRFVFLAFQSHEFLSLPFLMLFQFGFTYVAVSSIWELAVRMRQRETNLPISFDSLA